MKFRTIGFFNTYISPKAPSLVNEVLRTTFLSEGKKVKCFEDKLKELLRAKYVVTVNSGTSALHLAMILTGVHQGDEVICPAQTFIASALAIKYVGATPIFADIQYETGNIDPQSIEKKISKKTKAIVVVHWGGYPCDMDEIGAIAQKHKLMVIEDAAHALGAVYRGKMVGSISPLTCFSFQAIKHVTTGDGGAVCVKNSSQARSAFNLRWFGIDRERDKPSILGERGYNLKQLGYKFHLNDYGAALGLANLDGFDKRLQRRREIAAEYRRSLSDVAGLKLFNYKADRQSAYWLFGLHVVRRVDFIKKMLAHRIMVSVVHQRIDKNEIFGGINKDLFNQKRFDENQIHIPIHDALTSRQVNYIIKAIRRGW